MVEHSLVDVKQLLTLLRADGFRRGIDSTCQEIGIVEACVEVHPTLAILNKDVGGVVGKGIDETASFTKRNYFIKQIFLRLLFHMSSNNTK